MIFLHELLAVLCVVLAPYTSHSEAVLLIGLWNLLEVISLRLRDLQRDRTP